MSDYEYMLLAIKEARKAYKNDEVPVGAVIVEKGRIIAKAYNKKEKTKCSIDHAEIIAIKKACGKISNWRLTNSSLYVTLEPCPMCASAIKQSRINRVVYLLENRNANMRKIVNDILLVKDSNKPVDKVKLDIKQFDSKDVEMLSSFFKTKRY